ncbi:hypothetical protein KI387_035040, partial [Taxus chinensis]
FPISVQCADTVLSCRAHFDPASSQLTNIQWGTHRQIGCCRLISTAMRIPEMDNAIVVSWDQAQALFDQD